MKKSFILSLYPNIMPEIIQLLMLIAKYYIYMFRNNKCAMNFKGVLSSVPRHGFSSNLHINNSLYTNYENVFIELDS